MEGWEGALEEILESDRRVAIPRVDGPFVDDQRQAIVGDIAIVGEAVLGVLHGGETTIGAAKFRL